MPQITGIAAVKDKLAALAAKSKQEDDVSVIVGYTAAYALWVHEAVEEKLRGLPRAGGKGFYWDPQGQAQAKFLETPAREYRDQIVKIVVNAKKNGASLLEALLMGGLFLQRQSMQLVPVDTGNLKASAFTRQDDGDE